MERVARRLLKSLVHQNSNTMTMRFSQFVAAITFLFLFACIAPAAAQFQRQYGTALDEVFTKVIPSGANYYVLGQGEITDGQPARATVSRLNAAGELQWTLSLNIASVWNDAVLTPSGNLLVAGNSLPNDNTSRGIMGLVTTSGAFTWVRGYDLPLRDGFWRIVRNAVPQNPAFPYYVLGSQTDAMTSNTDMFLLNLNESGTLNWKKLYFGPIFFTGSKIPRDLEALPNGDLLIAANFDAQGVIMRTDNGGQPFNGVTPDGGFVFEDIALGAGGNVYAVGTGLQNSQHYVMKFDADLLGIWDVILEGMTEIHHVLPAGEIYVMAKKGFKECANRITETGGAPTLDWVKFLDNGFTATTPGALDLNASGQLVFADGRTPVSGGFGQLCAFVSVSGPDLDPCFTSDEAGAISPGNIIYSGPLLPDADFYDVPPSANFTGSLSTWQQAVACGPPCEASISVNYIDNCGHVQLTAVGSGLQPFNYQWCSGESTATIDRILPCGSHDFCVSVTCADGTVASASTTVVISDNIPPTIVCPPNVQLTCSGPTSPAATGFASATDNCSIPLVTFTDVVTGSAPCSQLIVRTWKAEDDCGNIATCVQTIAVMDNIPPAINCPQDMTVTALAPDCDVAVQGIHPLGATDNCATPTVNYSISGATTASGTGDASGTTFSPGTSTITYTAADACNNMASCSFDVTVQCDTCSCLGFSGLAFYNFLGLPDIATECDTTPVNLPCIGRDALYWFQWQLNCSDPLCVKSASYSIVSTAGGPPLLSGTIAPGNPHFIAFAYAQLAGAGSYQLILTGSCNGAECICVVNFTLPECCECGGFSEMTWRPTQGIMNLPFMCGDTMGVICDQAFFPQVAGMFQCVGTQCPANQTIQWELKDPAGMVIQSGPLTFQTNFLLSLDPAWFVQPGIYTLTFTGQCAGQTCDPCVLYLESAGCLIPNDNCCLEWAGKFGGTADVTAFHSTIDIAGNVYVAGRFWGTADFDPGPGVSNLTAAPQGQSNSFVVKLSASGHLIWAINIGSVDIVGISYDGAGNLLVAGNFTGTVDFDPGPNIQLLTSQGLSDVFLLRMDLSGNFVWASQFGGASDDICRGIAVGSGGEIIIVGRFQGTANFDPGPSTFNLSPFGTVDAFIVKVSALGSLIWAKQVGGLSGIADPSDVAVDQNDNIIVSGVFTGTIDFDPGPGTFLLSSPTGTPSLFFPSFITKFNPNGDFQWAGAFHKVAGGNAVDPINSIATDFQGNIYATGFFSGAVDFDPGAGSAVMTSQSGDNIFICKWSSSGGFIWSKQMGGPSQGHAGTAITTDVQGSIYTTGYFTGTTDFDPGPGLFPLAASSPAFRRTFIQKLNPAGDLTWAKQIEGQWSFGRSIEVDNTGSIYCAGFFRGTADFDPGQIQYLLSSSVPYSDAFIFKLGPCLPLDTCFCLGFSEMFLRGPQGAMSQPVACGDPPLNLGCPSSGIGYTLTGNFQCQGDDCPSMADIAWELLGPNGASIASATTQSTPLFGITLPASHFSQQGVYTLNITGYCGSDTCHCSITFLVEDCPDPCPCDLPTLISDVNQGFAHANSTTSCNVCFTPLGLSDCDDVEWMINSPINPPVGTSQGNQTFCHIFPSSGTYTVYMTVLRRRSDGSLCESWVYSRTITLSCTKQAECETSVYPNPSFEEGAVLGSFLEDGATAGWTRHWGDPHVEERAGYKVIKKRGNFNSADVTGTIEPICLAKDTGTISLRHGIKTQGIRSAIVVQLFSGDNYEFGVCESADCYEVARIELPDSDNPEEEFEVEIPYDISSWDAAAVCGDQPGVRVRPAIFVTSPFSDEQGPGSLTIIDLDYFCVDGQLLTGTQNPDQANALRLYPNPTSTSFTLELPEPATPGTSFRIAGLTGQTLLQQRAEAGSKLHVFDLSALPTGMYFVQVWKEGSVMGVGKVVRQ